MSNLIQHHTLRIEHQKQYEKKGVPPQNQNTLIMNVIQNLRMSKLRQGFLNLRFRIEAVYIMAMNIQTPSYYQKHFPPLIPLPIVQSGNNKRNVYEPNIPLSATADLISSSTTVLFDDGGQPQLSYNTDEQASYANF